MARLCKALRENPPKKCHQGSCNRYDVCVLEQLFYKGEEDEEDEVDEMEIPYRTRQCLIAASPFPMFVVSLLCLDRNRNRKRTRCLIEPKIGYCTMAKCM